MAEHVYTSLKNETVRMFKSDFVEFFSRVHPATPLVLYLPVIAYMLYVALSRAQLSILSVTELFAFGLVIWTLLEYIIHRYAFHYEPKTRIGKQLHFIVHGVHHDYPNDAKRLVMPPAVSIPLAIVFYGLFVFLFGNAAPAIWAGLAGGYVCYDSIHYAIHHFPMKGTVWHRLKQHHLRHHYQDDRAGYGVSSPFWDYIFRTTRR
jgi:sterol desaturase/sphingolipid hydroxylase (fatty acid hydroxylase superfamily)